MAAKKLYQSVEFWTDKIKFLDDRIKLITNTFGFGKVGMEIIIKHGRVIDVTFYENITVRQERKEDKKDDKKKKKDAGK